MSIFFTSDTHFYHKAIIGYCNRPVPPISDTNDDPTAQVLMMNEWLISRWNAVVKPEDEVWHLGDFVFCGKEKLFGVLDRLNGRKNLVLGNHDYGASKYLLQVAATKPYFESIQHYKFLRLNISYEADDGSTQQYVQSMVLSHFPILSWDGMAHGSWMLHGHCHGSIDHTWNSTGLRMDVGVDAEDNGYAPVSLAQIQKRMSLRTVTPVDHHK